MHEHVMSVWEYVYFYLPRALASQQHKKLMIIHFLANFFFIQHYNRIHIYIYRNRFKLHMVKKDYNYYKYSNYNLINYPHLLSSKPISKSKKIWLLTLSLIYFLSLSLSLSLSVSLYTFLSLFILHHLHRLMEKKNCV